MVPVKNEKVTDPRFLEDVTQFSQVAFDKRYSFVADMEKNERDQLSKKLRKVKNKELKSDIHKLINRSVKCHFNRNYDVIKLKKSDYDVTKLQNDAIMTS